MGANCFHAVDNDGATTGPVNFSIIAIENDPNFHRFDSCAMLSFTDLMSGNIVEVTDVACVQPARASADNTTTDYRRWEFAENIADGTTSAAAGADTNSNCGAYKDVSTLKGQHTRFRYTNSICIDSPEPCCPYS